MILRGSTEMTTYETVPSLREFAGMRLAMWASKRQRKAQASVDASRVTVVGNALVRVLLHLAGFALLTMAAFQFNIIAGLSAAGVSCFVLSTLLTRSDNGGGDDVRRAPDLRTGR